MLNSTHFVALHVLMDTMSSFAISSQGLEAKFDAILMLLIGSLVCSASRLPLTLKLMKMVNS